MNLASRLGLTECEPKIYFLRELAAIVRELPLKVFTTPEDRLRLIEGVQDALDTAIDEEDDQAFAETAPSGDGETCPKERESAK